MSHRDRRENRRTVGRSDGRTVGTHHASTLPRFHASTFWVAAALAATAVLGWIIMATARAEVNSAVDGIAYDGDGTTTEFSFAFPVMSTSQVRVVKRTVATGDEAVLTLNSDYTIADDDGDGDYTDGPGGAVTLTTAPSSAYEIYISRLPALTQDYDLDSTGYLRLAALEDAIDRLVYHDQYLRRLMRRAILIPETEAGVRDMNLPSSVTRAGGYAYFDSSGDVTTAVPVVAADANIATDWLDILDGTTTTTANGRTVYEQLLVPHFNVMHYGATGDGETNDTTAVEAALDAARAVRGAIVYFPPGVYRVQLTFDEVVGTSTANYPTLQGAGARATRLMAVDVNEYAITMTGVQGSIWTWAIRDLAFDGDVRAHNGMHVINAAGATNLRMNNVAFFRCDIAFKSQGQLDTWANNVHFYGCDYGIWIDDYGTQHGGCQHWYDISAFYNHKPVVVQGGSQLEFRHGRIENNYGWAFFIENAGSTGTYPTVIEDFWMEGNNLWDVEEVNGVNYDVDGYYYFDNCYVILNGMILHQMEVKNGATVRANNCMVWNPDNVNVNIPDANSVFIGTNCTVASSSSSHSEIGLDFTPGAWGSVSALDPAASPQVLASRTSIQSEVCYEKANLLDYGWCAASFTPETVGAGNAYSFVDDQSPPIHGGRCLQMQLPANMTYGTNNLKLWTTNYTTTLGKWYLFTMDVKAVGEDGWLALASKWGTSSLFVNLRENTTNEARYGYGMKVTTDQWRRYSQLRRANATQAISNWSFYNPHPTADPNYLVANAQFLEFDSAQQAIEYIYTGKVAADKSFPRLWWDDIAKTADYDPVPTADNGAFFSNVGASATVTFELDPALVGHKYTFLAAEDDDIIVDPNGSQVFRGKAAGKYLRLDDQGCTATIQCFTAGVWDIVAAYDPNMAGEDPFKWEP